MKRTAKILFVFLALLFLLSCCGCSFTATEKEPSPGEAQLSLEELIEIREQAFYYLNNLEEYGIYSYRLTQEIYNQAIKKPEEYHLYGAYDGVRMSYVAISDRTTFLSPQAVSQVEKGMLLGDVTALLGQPDLNAYCDIYTAYFSGSSREANDFYTLYLLSDGRFLTIRYVPAFVGEYGREVLMEKIPDFEEYERIPKRLEYLYWGKVGYVDVLTLEELCALPFERAKWGSDDFFLRTADEDLPPYISSVNLADKVKQGMTYEEVKEIFGSCGMDMGVYYSHNYDDPARRSCYLYCWHASKKMSVWIYFALEDDGRLTVYKIGS
jgi:hypothetical protein